MPRRGTGYTLADNDMTATRSAYCPICCTKTVQIEGWHEPVYPSTIPGLSPLKGCVIAQVLCCSARCLKDYQARIKALSSPIHRHTALVTNYCYMGALSDVVAQLIADQAG
jgi:hypothetical protein